MASSLVLLVDDGIELANMRGVLLAREGIQAHAAFTGEAGRSRFESERAMLANARDKRAPGDVLLLDRGNPASWLIYALCT